PAVVRQRAAGARRGRADPLGGPLPGTVPDGAAITVRRRLDHTSGLYDYMKEPGMSTNRWRGEDRFRSYSAGDLLRTAFRNPPYFPPGEGFRYSNTNYVLLGELIEAVTANPYGEEVEKRIIEPLELRDTALPGTDPEIPEPAVRAQGVLGDGRTVDVTEMDPSLDRAAGEMISSTRDLAVFLDALLSAELVSADALAEMRGTEPMGMGFHYGLGLQRFDAPCGGRLWGHGGQLLGYRTYAYRSDDGRTLTMVAASDRSPDYATLLASVTAVFCAA